MPQIIAPPEHEFQVGPIITTCPHCHYEISYTEDEVDRVSNNAMGIVCPHCEGVIEIKYVESFTFPDTFYCFGSGKDTAHLSDKEIQSNIDIVKRELQQELKVGEYKFIGSGDTMVFGFKFENEDMIIVAKNYWEDSVFH